MQKMTQVDADIISQNNSIVMKVVKSGIVPTKGINLPRRIILIEDDVEFAEIAAHAIEQNSKSNVTIAHDPFEATNLMSEDVFDLVITDWKLPELNGFGTLRKVNRSLDSDPSAPDSWFERKTPVIVLTICSKSDIAQEKKIQGHFRYLGMVSKDQAIMQILQEMSRLYNNGEHFLNPLLTNSRSFSA